MTGAGGDGGLGGIGGGCGLGGSAGGCVKHAADEHAVRLSKWASCSVHSKLADPRVQFTS